MLKFLLFFSAIANHPDGFSAMNAAGKEPFRKISEIPLQSQDITPDSLVIATHNGIFVCNPTGWNFVAVKGKFLVCVDVRNTVYIAGESFLGKLVVSAKKDKNYIDTIISTQKTLLWERPEKLFHWNGAVYLATAKKLYRLNGRKLDPVDSSRSGILVFPARTGIYLFKGGNQAMRMMDDGKQSLAEIPPFAVEDLPTGFYEIVKDKPYRKPFFYRWWAWLCYAGFFLICVWAFWRKRRHDFEKEKAELEQIIRDRTAELILEKEKTDELLANLLPKDTADELKNTGKATSQKFDMATVLFSDIQGFTRIAEQMNPEMLIDELDNFFFHFDSVVEKYNIEKIKTIGDAYMCAGGIPYKNRTNPVEVVLAAVEMQEYMRQLKNKKNHIWDLRIGIHTGAVIAGVVGHKRMSYDIWGDTVNTASRMESSGEPGKVNISGHTYGLVKDFFVCEYRGRMPVKYKGDVDMYFVKSIRPELSIDLSVIPNKLFFIRLQLLRLLDLEEFVMDKLGKELPVNMYFHDVQHAKDVYIMVELLARAENVTLEELLLLKTAALLVYTGFTKTYDDYENESVCFARLVLPKYKYSREQVDLICNLILSIRFTGNIKNKLEAVLMDACLNYLGSADYIGQSRKFYSEVKERIASLSEKEWFYHELRLVERYKFYTSAAKKLREVSVDEQIRRIKDFAKLN